MAAGTPPDSADPVRYRVTVSGRVQGVWYRESCRRVAEAEGVAGWVRNNRDGTVEAAIEGAAPRVARVLAWMREGPRRAVVTDVHVQEAVPEGALGFTVR